MNRKPKGHRKESYNNSMGIMYPIGSLSELYEQPTVVVLVRSLVTVMINS